MKIEQEVYGLHGGKEYFDAHETEEKHKEKHEKKGDKEDKENEEEDESNEAYGLQG
jgi:hypothetical protein